MWLLQSLITVSLLTNSAAATTTTTISEYRKVYPNFIAFCALSDGQEIIEISQDFLDAGHITLYVENACLDKKKKYPHLKVCDPGQHSSLKGTMLSVNSLAKNANWIGIPSFELAISGLHDADKRVTSSAVQHSLKLAIATGSYKGVEVHSDTHLPHKELLRRIARNSLSMEVGMRMGRNVYCSRLPIESHILPKLIAHLNNVNSIYKQKNKIFNWHPLFNNCAHLAHNALASLHVWGFKETDASLIDQLSNIAVPANEMLDLMYIGNDVDLSHPSSIYKNQFFYKSIMDNNWLPTRHGVLHEHLPVFSKNDVFNTHGLKLKSYQLPGSLTKYKKFYKKMNSDSRYFDIQSNLEFFRTKYKTALESRPSLSEELSALPQIDHDAFVKFYKKYYTYLEAQLADVDKKLQELL